MLGDLLDFGMGVLTDSRRRKEFNKTFNESTRQFNEVTRKSIQNRVQDAEKAGIHPLFALGASAGGSPTMSVGASATGGARTSAAAGRIANRLAAAQIRKTEAEAKKSEAEAALANSNQRRIEQRTESTGKDAIPQNPVNQSLEDQGLVEMIAPQVYKRSRPGVQAGVNPLVKEFEDEAGRTIKMFSDSAQADEINQAWLVKQLAQNALTDLFERAGNRNRIAAADVARTKEKVRKAVKRAFAAGYSPVKALDPALWKPRRRKSRLYIEKRASQAELYRRRYGRK